MGLKRLHTLNLEGQSITSIEPLSGLTNLEYLELRYNQIEDVSPISKLGKIRRLNLDDNQLKQLPDISRLSSLEELSVTRNQISELPNITSSSLRHLNLGDNAIRGLAVSGLEQLSYLGLSDNPLESLTFADDQTIGQLAIDRTGFNDLSSLKNTNATLHTLEARQNGITSIETLATFTRLNGLYLEDNEIVTIGSTFDAMSGTYVQMWGNPLLCTEVARLDELPVNVDFNGQCATDTDGDGSVDGRDAFPNDMQPRLIPTAMARLMTGTQALQPLIRPRGSSLMAMMMMMASTMMQMLFRLMPSKTRTQMEMAWAITRMLSRMIPISSILVSKTRLRAWKALTYSSACAKKPMV